MLRADGGGNVELTLDPEQGAYAASWLPDGRSVIYKGWRDGAPWMIEIEIESRAITKRFQVPPAWQILRLSPDATQVAFQAQSEGRSENVWLAPFGSDEAKQVTHEKGFAGFARWSPDGERLAVEVSRANGTQVAVVPRGGGALLQLTDEPGETWPGSWSPDGERILLSTRREGFWDLRWISVAKGEERILTPERSLRVYYRDPDWSAQGDRIVYERGEISSDLWEIELPAEDLVVHPFDHLLLDHFTRCASDRCCGAGFG
jgi:Tol biopolymer transport system component